jgi:hypothetical protein
MVESIEVSNFPKTVFIMAFGAVGSKTAFMYVFVAGVAIFGFHPVPILKNSERRGVEVVAFPAINRFVFAFERKKRFAMVELVQFPRPGERLFRVAFLAVGPQVIVVDILVATVAVGKCHTGKFLELLAVSRFFQMAFYTGHCFVFSGQRKIRFIVVKTGRRFECVGGMALRAVIPQRFLVSVGMAGYTILLQSQKSSLSFFQTRVCYVIRLVAFPAIYFFVCAGQFIACFGVIKRFFIEMNHLEIPSVVFIVASRAILISHVRTCVKTDIPVEPQFDFLVATEALVVWNLVSNIVATGAIGNAFQIFVRGGQVAGR